MTASQYKNIIRNTVKNISGNKKFDSVYVVSSILKNMGVAFPEASCEEILYILLSGTYMGWRECTSSEAQTMANSGFPTIAVSSSSVSVIEPECETTLSASAFSLNANSTENVSVLSDLTIHDRAGATYFYYNEENKPGTFQIPIRIAQNSNDDDWDASLWTPYQNKAYQGCAVACIAMALSCLGYTKTPGEIIGMFNGSVYVPNWNLKNVNSYWSDLSCIYKSVSSSPATVSDISAAATRYITDFEHYAPPIVGVTTRDNHSNHYIVVCSYNSVEDTFRAVDPGGHGHNYDYWKSSDITGQMIQYYF